MLRTGKRHPAARQRPRRAIGTFVSAGVILSVVSLLTPVTARAEGELDDGPAPAAATGETVIGWVSDFGYIHPDMVFLREQVDEWEVDHVVSTGDNWQYSTWPGGHDDPEPTGTDRYDRVVGSIFCEYLRAASGPLCPSHRQSPTNRFFPVAGNHDHDDGPLANYLAYFNLPGAGTTSTHPSGSELYYDVVLGDVHLFVIDSESVSVEAEGGTPAVPTSVQKAWLEDALDSSNAPWKVVALHEPVYGSSVHYGSNPALQWDFADWGVDAVINGHASLYERVHRDGVVYITAGLGGGIGDDGVIQTGTCRPSGSRVEGSQVCIGRGDRPYLSDGTELMGAVKIVATPTELSFDAWTIEPGHRHLLDSYSITKSAPTPPTITTSSPLPSGQVGTPYSTTLQASGGTTPYTWQRTGGDQLHPGLSLNATTGTISGTPTTAGTRTIQFRATGANGAQSAIKSLTLTVAHPPVVDPDGGGFVGMAPTRVLDTRTNGPCVSGSTGRQVTVAGVHGVPPDAVAIAANVTVVGPGSPGYLTVHPSGSPRPTASNLNYERGDVVPNLVTTKVGTGGRITLYASGGCPHVIVDVAGYYTAGETAPGGFVGIPPRRALDTRTSGPCVSGSAGRALVVAPSAGVPADAAAVALNVTVVRPGSPGYLTVHPNGEPRPTASNVNFDKGQVVPNHVTVKVGAGGAIRLYASGGCPHVIVDVAGYYTAGTPGEGGFTGITPTRVLDTRTSGTCVSGAAGRQLIVAPTPPSVPADAAAVALNVTVVRPGSPGYLTVHPDGVPRPTASNVNFDKGQVVANAALVKVGTDGRLRLYASGGCPHVVVDVVGYHHG